MTVSPTIVPVNTAIENWLSVLDKINELIDFADNYTVSVDTSANGSLSTGNGYVNGIFSALTLACSTIRGGNVQANGTLTIYANLISVGNSTVNTVANSTQITVSKIVLGNTTVGFIANTTGIRLNGKDYANLDPFVIVANNGVDIGTRPRINFIEGDNITLDVVDDAGNSEVMVTINSTGGGGNASVAGTNTQVQYNDSGNMGAGAGLTFIKTSNTLNVANAVNTQVLLFPMARFNQIYANSATVSSVVLDSFFLADYRSAKYLLTIKDNTANAYQTTEILAIHNDGAAQMTEYGTIFTNTDIATFTVSTNATHMILNYAGGTANTTIKGIRELIAV